MASSSSFPRSGAEPRHIVWDWNGTLLDDFSICVAAADRASRLAVGVGVSDNAYRKHFTRPIRTFYERLAARPVSDSEWRLIVQEYHSCYAELLETAVLRTGALAALECAGRQGMTQSLLSMAGHDQLVRLVRRHGLDRYFLVVDGSNGEARTASKRDMLVSHLRSVQRRCGTELAPHAVLLVGDTLDDAVAAAAVGARCALLADGSLDVDAAAACGYHLVPCLLSAVNLGFDRPDPELPTSAVAVKALRARGH